MNDSAKFDWETARLKLRNAEQSLEIDARPESLRRTLLAERAARLALPTVSPTTAELQIMVFGIGPERYAFPVTVISEVVARPRIGVAPGAPSEVAGLVQIRGEIRPIWNLWRLLATAEPPSAEDQMMILLRTDGKEFGILTGAIERIRPVTTATRLPAPENARYASWMTEDFVIVLDAGLLLREQTEENS